MKNNRIYLSIGGIIVLAVAALVFIYPNASLAPANTQPTNQNAVQGNTVSLNVQGLYTDKGIAITADETVLQVLQALDAQDAQLQLTTKVYAGMGTLVTGMHGEVNGAGKSYWQYKVNGVAPQIGADAYKLKSGDTIEWFFGSSQE